MTSSFVLCNHLPYCLVKTGGLIEEFKQDLESRNCIKANETIVS